MGFAADYSIHSSVLVLHEQSSDALILTKRSEQLRAHPGEICFPGGLKEKGDEDLYTTALREVDEELGISAHRIQFIKAMAVEKTLLGVTIHPWFARIDSIEPFKMNTEEVIAVIRVPMVLAQTAKHYSEFVVHRKGVRFISCRFTAHQELIWGATARIMKQLSL